MDPALYKAAMKGSQSLFQELVTNSDSSILLQELSQKETVLHVAAKFNQHRIAETILTLQPSLAFKTNSEGDSPLHVAARLKSTKVVQVLLNHVKAAKTPELADEEAGESLLRMMNAKKDTALHEAARSGCVQTVTLLLKEDPELASFTNEAGESPLFLAVDRIHFVMAHKILSSAPHVCSFQGRNHMTALHAAVVRSHVGVSISSNFYLNFFMKHYLKQFYFIPNLVIKALFGAALIFIPFLTKVNKPNLHKDRIYIDFIKLLMQKCPSAIFQADDFGWTPLHYAANLGDEEIVKLFLEHDKSIANVNDKQGMSVLHVAAKEGQVKILRILEDLCPDIWDSQDNKGRTVLHIAVESGKLEAVRFILGTLISKVLINMQDNEGNTALHLAILKNFKIFHLLWTDRRTNRKATNKEGLAIINMEWFNNRLGSLAKERITLPVEARRGLGSLERAINRGEAPKQSADKREETEIKEERSIAELEGVKKPGFEHLRNIATTNLVVTTLIATVSFAAGFTMPGGYKSDGPDQGMAILSRRSAFRASVISNALAFCFSTASMCLHYFNSLGLNHDALVFYTSWALELTFYAITAMVVAFISGTYAALADSPALAAALLAIGCCFFALQFLVFGKK